MLGLSVSSRLGAALEVIKVRPARSRLRALAVATAAVLFIAAAIVWAGPSDASPVDRNSPRGFVTIICDFGCGSEIEYFTQPGDWVWAIARDYLAWTKAADQSPHAVRLLADEIYRRNPAAFSRSPNRLKIGEYLSVAGKIDSTRATPLPVG
jgi:hypothetical protein